MTRRRLRTSLAALLLAATGVVSVGATSAEARYCPAGDPTMQAHALGADDVFTGTVTERSVEGPEVVYVVEVDRVYKGGIDATDASVTTARAARACGLPDLEVDTAYVFFTTGDDLRTSASAGTAPVTDVRVARVERLLGEGRSPTPPEPEEATFTPVADEPMSLDRVAAPGLALVIVGVLGLGLAIGLGRRR